MAQKYKVYFANSPLVFTNDSEEPLASNGYELLVSQGKSDTMLVESAIAGGAKGVYLTCRDIEKSWKDFSSQFRLIRAAGGLVLNDQDEVLFIYRLEKWDLPKGKVEENEELEWAALREVEEECSIGNLELVRHLITTYHTYALKGEQVLKSTDWYIMKHTGHDIPQPQTIEGITDARWIAPSNWAMVESNTFPSVIDVLRAFESSR
jgi:8-oxo-dGTP pyrophosphatase MutT (NUDIX family)